MKRIKAFLYVFSKSVVSPKYYRDVVKAKLSFSLKYFVVLALVASFITFSMMIKPVTQYLAKSVSEIENSIVNTYPQDLVVTLKSGELSINQPEPYIFKMPKDLPAGEMQTEDVPTTTNLIVFSSTGTLDDLQKYDTLVLVNKANILVKGNNKVEVYPLKDYPDTQITSGTVKSFAAKAEPFVKALPYVVLAFALLGTLIYYFGFRLAYLILVALILMVFGTLRGTKLKFSKYYQIAIHALTLPLIVEILSLIFNYTTPYLHLFLVLNVLVGIIAIVNTRVDAPTKS